MPKARPYIPRYVDAALDRLFTELPAIMLTGPRSCGKTTTALRRAGLTLRLDRPEQATAFAAAPDAVLGALVPPVLLDEWQVVPESIGAVKRAVDADASAGRFLITGSVRARHTTPGWPATGRVTPLAMYGLTVGELERSAQAAHIVDRLFGEDDPTVGALAPAPTLTDYVDHAVRGGFPSAVDLTDTARSAWYDGYVEQLVHYDLAELAAVRSPGGFARLLRAVALNIAGMPSLTALGEAGQLNHRTLATYLDLLEDLRVIERLPAWSSNRLKRLVKTPKYYVIDPGLAAHLAGDDRAGLLTSGDRLGRLIDTFTVAQLRPLLRLASPAVNAFHLRDGNGRREIDLVLESAAGRLVAIEIKASSAVDERAARHLAWLRDATGEAFIRGIVLHTGPMTVPLGDRLWAMPIAALWQAEW